MKLFKWFKSSPKEIFTTIAVAATDEQIIMAMDPWTLACATGAENGTVEGLSCGFDMWLSLSKKNWMPKVLSTIKCTDRGVESALRRFVARNVAKHYRQVLSEQTALRGQPSPLVLGPGESGTMSIGLANQPRVDSDSDRQPAKPTKGVTR